METINRHESGLVIKVTKTKNTYFIMDEKTEVVYDRVSTLRKANNAFKRTLKLQGLA